MIQLRVCVVVHHLADHLGEVVLHALQFNLGICMLVLELSQLEIKVIQKQFVVFEASGLELFNLKKVWSGAMTYQFVRFCEIFRGKIKFVYE